MCDTKIFVGPEKTQAFAEKIQKFWHELKHFNLKTEQYGSSPVHLTTGLSFGHFFGNQRLVDLSE